MFVPSKYAFRTGILLASIVAALVAFWCHWALGLVIWVLLLGEVKRERSAHMLVLHWDERKRCWRDNSGAEAALTAVRVGPSIVGVRYRRRIIWLWPDSAPPETLWQLRRWLNCQ